MSECTNTNKLLFFGSLGLNIFLIAFYLGGHLNHWRHHHCHFGDHGSMGRFMGMRDSDRGLEFGHDGRFGENQMHGGGQPFIMSQLFSRSEIESNREFIRERVKHIQSIKKDLADSLKSGQAAPDIIKAHFAQIDQTKNEIRSHMEQKVMEKINAMTPEEKARFGESLKEKHDRLEKHEGISKHETRGDQEEDQQQE